MQALRNIIAVTAMAIPLAGTAPLAASAATASSPAAAHSTTGAAPHAATGPSGAAASPDGFSQCTTGSSSGNVSTCLDISGDGLHVNTMTASAEVISSERTIQVCLRGPNGTIGCTPGTSTFDPVTPGHSISFIWAPESNVPAGTYCARTFRLNSDGTDTMIGQQCADVHA